MFGRLTILVLLCTFYGHHASFSQARINFLETSFDFGEIHEGTAAEHEFTFSNTGDQPLILISVKASCGCTTPFWTKEPILPGNSGRIKASYNSKNRPGGFHKSITVNSNAATPTKMLYIKGVAVKGIELKPLFTEEEIKKGPKALISQEHIQLGKVQMGSSIPLNITIENQGMRPLEIKGIHSRCGCLNLMPGKNLVVEPAAEGELELVFTPKAQGKFTYEAYVLSNDPVRSKYQISISSMVVAPEDQSSVVKETPLKITF